MATSSDLNYDEKVAIITAFTDELAKHIGSKDDLSSYEYISSLSSLSYIDRSLSDIMANKNMSHRSYDKALALCARQKNLFALFAEKKWNYSDISNTDIDVYETNIRKKYESDTSAEKILALDSEIERLMKQAEKELNVEICNSVCLLLDELCQELQHCSQKKIAVPSIKHADIKQNIVRITRLKNKAESKEQLYYDINEIDSKIHNIELLQQATPEQWQNAIDLCQELGNSLSLCQKENWKIPFIRYNAPDKLVHKYSHYQNMLNFDQSIDSIKDSLKTDTQYYTFYEYCAQQDKNINICINNGWEIPTLSNSDPSTLADKTRQTKFQIDKTKKNKGRLILIATVAILIFIFVVFCVAKYREGKVVIPFDAGYAIGENYTYIEKELKDAGFESIMLISDDSGWLKDNSVISVSVDNETDFSKGKYCEPEVTVVIKYSSSGREDVSDYLSEWKNSKYTDIQSKLIAAGFSNIVLQEVNTFDKNQDQLISSITMDGKAYTNGQCYLPKKAPIEISYYSLKIAMSNDNIAFKGQDYISVVKRLEEDGFTNIQTEEIETGWSKGNSVISVTVNNQTTYNIDDTFEPDVRIVIKYSSDNRLNATTYFEDSHNHTYKELQNKLSAAGFTNVTLQTVDTTTISQNGLVSDISVHGQNFTGGECYIQKSAPVIISHYYLKIAVDKDASEINEKQYSEIIEELKVKGFSNIVVYRTDDMNFFSWFTEEGSIKSISINGNKDFKKNDLFYYDTEIVIVVNTFDGKGCEDITLKTK